MTKKDIIINMDIVEYTYRKIIVKTQKRANSLKNEDAKSQV